jgi:hypothetical protein
MPRYIVYHKDTTRFLSLHPGVKTDHASFASEGAAKAALTRAIKDTASKVQPILRENFLITEDDNFFCNVQKTVTKKNLMTGVEFQQAVNTPMICDPSTETYWSV